jgi:superfamily II DNA or RNA helicase
MPSRDYQIAAVSALRALRASGKRRLLLCLCTGGGKTHIACDIIEGALRHEQRVLVIGHRKEIIDQFWGALRRRGIIAGIVRADDSRTDPSGMVQVASVATLVRRGLPPADLVVIDEAHRTPGESYVQILQAYPKATVIGLSATPARLDGSALLEHFDALHVGAAYSELIAQGHILAPRVFAPRRSVDVGGVRKRAGDFVEAQLERAVMPLVGDIVKEWRQHAEGYSTVCFAVSIRHSQAIVESFTQAGITAEHLDGDTSEDERLAILMRLETGRTLVVSNVGVLCEGWDQPRVKCCIMARPTLSLVLYMQCVGRILRPCPGSHPLVPVVLDHAGNVTRHGLPHEDREWALAGGQPRRANPIQAHVCGGCYAYVLQSPCELCGFVRPDTERRRTGVHRVAGVLEEVYQTVDPRRALFDRMANKARELGFRPGYASALVKEKFGDWPPYAWKAEQDALYKADAEWQARVAERAAARAFWQTVKPAAEEAKPGASVPEAEYFTAEDL